MPDNVLFFYGRVGGGDSCLWWGCLFEMDAWAVKVEDRNLDCKKEQPTVRVYTTERVQRFPI